MEAHIGPEDAVTDYYAEEFTTSQQLPLVKDDTGTYYNSSLLAAMGTPYGMFSEEPCYFPAPGLMLAPMWSSIPEEDLSSQELLSQPSLQSVPLPLTEMKYPVERKNAARRRILTNEERQGIRLYHEENKRVTHSRIAALFGVDRTTVTKVLRSSTKSTKPDHMCQNQPEGASIPISKMQNGKTPDVGKALLIWAAKQQNGGVDIDESQIISQAQHFASACGYPELAEKFEAPEWLENFRSKNLSNDPLCSENQNTSYTPTTTNCLSVDGIAVRGLGVRPHVPVENGAGHSMPPAEVDEGKNTAGKSPQVGSEFEVKKALELVNNHFQKPGLSAQESASIDRMRDILEERILSSGTISQG